MNFEKDILLLHQYNPNPLLNQVILFVQPSDLFVIYDNQIVVQSFPVLDDMILAIFVDRCQLHHFVRVSVFVIIFDVLKQVQN